MKHLSKRRKRKQSAPHFRSEQAIRMLRMNIRMIRMKFKVVIRILFGWALSDCRSPKGEGALFGCYNSDVIWRLGSLCDERERGANIPLVAASEEGIAQTQHHFCFAIFNFLRRGIVGKSGAGGCKEIASGAFFQSFLKFLEEGLPREST